MNGIAKLTAVVVLTGMPFSGAAYAAMEPAQQQVDQTVAHFKGDNINIQELGWVTQSAFDEDGSMAQQTPAETAKFQQALASNPQLVRQLKARNVEIGNVVGADQAADGSLTFYLR
ncbi:hypothetical protein SAMN05880582_101144 [Rhizobium sp. RU20A]|uniref:hypothetical protein n=1 Tax=Rhizobium sp. RU20A TaxID=1907412 RepID=UPI000954BEEE|nr:hypothetical protein [Rhizobium sp. RU20A]SIP95267.1 hypothetical protein SAMN05880582_101144 [Rhizobium sp. RU20A]